MWIFFTGALLVIIFVCFSISNFVERLAASEVYYKYDGRGLTKVIAIFTNPMVYRALIRKIKLRFGMITRPVVGTRAPDAELITVETGETRYLVKDYFQITSKIPLILNMGSYN